MDAMALAQLKRQEAWQAEELRHTQHDLQVAELALEGDKKKVEELHKKVTEGKRRHDTFAQEVMRAQEELRKAQAQGNRH